MLATFSLTPVQFGVLAHLSVRPPTTQAELARSVLVRPQSMDPLLRALESRGLIQRSSLRASGRPNPVTITAAGKQLLQEVWEPIMATNDLAAFGLDQNEGRRLNEKLLKIVTTNSDAHYPEPPR